jgi:hypothetical protein
MKLKALVTAVLFAYGLLATNQALARPDLTAEQLTKAQEAAAQLNPPVDFDALMDEADKLGVECTGDLTRKARIIICGQDVENAKIQGDINRLKAENSRLDQENARLDQETAKHIRELQRRIKENK